MAKTIRFEPRATRRNTLTEDPRFARLSLADRHVVASATTHDAPRQAFLANCQRVRTERGGRPTCELVNGEFVFTYPDGTKTIGGRVVS